MPTPLPPCPDDDDDCEEPIDIALREMLSDAEEATRHAHETVRLINRELARRFPLASSTRQENGHAR